MRNDERVFGSSKLRAKESLVAAKLSTYLFKNESSALNPAANRSWAWSK